jgi:hypothetical protein
MGRKIVLYKGKVAKMVQENWLIESSLKQCACPFYTLHVGDLMTVATGFLKSILLNAVLLTRDM